jgi:hypothetical protein
MSKKLVLFLLAFGFAASFANATTPGSQSCIRSAQASYTSCLSSGLYTSAQCQSAYQLSLQTCAESAKPPSGPGCTGDCPPVVIVTP